MDFFYVKGKCDFGELAMTVLVPLLAGVLSFLLVKNHTGVYVELAALRPLPPVTVLPVIWAVILLLMGLASYRMKLASPSSASHVYYAAQLLLFFIWNVALLRLEATGVALALIVLCLFFSTATFFEFEKTDKKAGRLILPSLLWAVLLAVGSFLAYRWS